MLQILNKTDKPVVMCDGCV